MHLKSPLSFLFICPDEWPSRKYHFEQSLDYQQKTILDMLFCMGEEVEDIPNPTNISNTERKKYNRVVTKFNNIFKVRKNVIFEHACFDPEEARHTLSATLIASLKIWLMALDPLIRIYSIILLYCCHSGKSLPFTSYSVLFIT